MNSKNRLRDIQSGQFCRVTWMIGEMADYIRRNFSLEENQLVFVNNNLGGGNMIISYENHHIAIDGDISEAVRVEPVCVPAWV